MGFLVAAMNFSPTFIVKSKHHQCQNEKLQGRCHSQSSSLFDRRGFLNCVGVSSLVATLEFSGLQAQAAAEDKVEEGEGVVVSAFKTLFDPNEKTKSGKELPKAYLKSAREVVKTMRESLKENPKDNAKFRRSADAAKESIRDYLSNWRGQNSVSGEESYAELENVIRALAKFYSKAGPSAPLPDEVKTEILDDLDKAEEFL
ncbi:PREDICTED: photosystem II D1 precursor processing protein PSB27-H2, chloroplastic-like [Camelina sativa]|uniref:Photosystem II D1 precursor processing protein PSB27-H2, chloroplastic-like n=1 Tax=Camelina sativa TaxID=90675 RepID=A0ABM0VKL1_CAMSA|nr:PREDICTED: photosystem II D1 precursor processing protein PSB27-H2, chloroplastic-like [Camelina sativa]